jgi:hypothetical protein
LIRLIGWNNFSHGNPPEIIMAGIQKVIAFYCKQLLDMSQLTEQADVT